MSEKTGRQQLADIKDQWKASKVQCLYAIDQAYEVGFLAGMRHAKNIISDETDAVARLQKMNLPQPQQAGEQP